MTEREVRNGRTKQIANPNEPASYKQVGYIGRLLMEKAYPQGLTKGEASDLIEELREGEGAAYVAAKLID